jgi:hypothetical protein
MEFSVYTVKSSLQLLENAFRFNLGSIEGSKKSGFGPYVTPPKRLRIFAPVATNQKAGSSNPPGRTILKSAQPNSYATVILSMCIMVCRLSRKTPALLSLSILAAKPHFFAVRSVEIGNGLFGVA